MYLSSIGIDGPTLLTDCCSFGVVAQQVHVLANVEHAAVGTLCLDQTEVNALRHVLSAILSVPSSGRVCPLIELGSPPVEDVGMKLHDRLIARLGLIDVVDAVAVGRESVGKVELALADGYGYGTRLCPIIGRIGHRVSALHIGGVAHDAVRASRRKGVVGVLVITYEIGILRFALCIEPPFVIGRIIAYVGRIGLEMNREGC